MQIERLKPRPFTALTAEEIAELALPHGGKNHRAMRNAIEAGHRQKLDDAMVARAAAFIEENHGILFSPVDIRLHADLDASAAEIHIPIAPVIGVSFVAVNGVVSQDWKLLRHVLRLPPAKEKRKVDLEFLAGFAERKLPFLVKLAIANICANWMAGNDDVSLADPYLAVFRSPRVHAGGIPWQH